MINDLNDLKEIKKSRNIKDYEYQIRKGLVKLT